MDVVSESACKGRVVSEYAVRDVEVTGNYALELEKIILEEQATNQRILVKWDAVQDGLMRLLFERMKELPEGYEASPGSDWHALPGKIVKMPWQIYYLPQTLISLQYRKGIQFTTVRPGYEHALVLDVGDEAELADFDHCKPWFRCRVLGLAQTEIQHIDQEEYRQFLASYPLDGRRADIAQVLSARYGVPVTRKHLVSLINMEVIDCYGKSPQRRWFYKALKRAKQILS